MKMGRNHFLRLLAVVFVLAIGVSIFALSTSAEDVTYETAVLLENKSVYAGSLLNPSKYPDDPKKDADWSSGYGGYTQSIADSIEMWTEGYGYYIDTEYYYDQDSYSSADFRLRNNWKGSPSDRIAVFAISAGRVGVGNTLFDLEESVYIVPESYGWHHVRAKITQKANAVLNADTGKYELDYDFAMEIYLDGELVRTFQAKEGAFEEHHYYFYYASVDPDTGAISYTSVKAAQAAGDITKDDNTFFYTYGPTGCFNGEKQGHQRFREIRVSWGSSAPKTVAPIKYNLNGGSYKTEDPIVEPTNEVIKGGYTWTSIPGATYIFTEVDHYYVDDGSATVTPTNPVKLGNQFLGWYTDEALTTPYDTESVKTGAITLYAKFSAPGQYQLTVYSLDAIKSETCYPTGESFVIGDEAQLWAASDGKIYRTGDTLTLTSDVSLYPVSIELLEGASVRLSASRSGLRFETRMPTALLDALMNVCGIYDYQIGTLILPTDMKSGDLTVETADALNLHSLMNNVAVIKGDDGYSYFYAAIVDILGKNYTRAFSAVSYIKVGDEILYTDYSAEDNSRSIWEVAYAAYLDESLAAEDLPIVKAYLDKVVFLTGVLNVVSIEGYTSPYTVSWASNVLTIAKKDGSFTSADEITSVIIDGRIYTSGWTLTDGKLTAPYTLAYYNTLDGITHATATNTTASAGISDNSFSVSAPSTGMGYTTVYCTDESGNSLNYIGVKTSQYEKFQGTVNLKLGSTTIGKVLGSDNTKLSITISMMMPEDVDNSHSITFMLRRKDMAHRTSFMSLSTTGNVTLPGGSVIGKLEKGTFNEFTVTLDFANNIITGYMNGVKTAEVEGAMAIPSADAETYTDLLSWAKACQYIFNGANVNPAGNGSSGTCFGAVTLLAHN